jgi:hypothetical protein
VSRPVYGPRVHRPMETSGSAAQATVRRPTHLCDRPECGEPTAVAFHVDRQEWMPRFWAFENGHKRMYCSEPCLELDLSRIMGRVS